jgi:phospholipid/cholesterol/gamma-HCH transport system substrate-binding protein
MRPGRTVLGVGVAAALALTSGCGFSGLYGKDLPGSVGGPLSSVKTYTVTVLFDNVLDLVPQSAVRVNDVTVGTVEKIQLVSDPSTQTFKAKVVCKVSKSVRLPQNSTALLEETSLLGEKFVELAPPTTTPEVGQLKDGAVIRDGSTSAYPDVEQVFGVLASVLNGGGLEKLQTINVELTAALSGRENKVRDVLRQLDTFVSGLDTQKSQITRAIQSLDKLSIDLNRNTDSIKIALRDLAPGIHVISENRSNLVKLLQALSDLGVVSTRVINASVDATKADLASLAPILTRLNQAGTALPGSLELLLDFPFPRDATNGIPGDNTSLTATVDGSSVCNASQLKALCAVLGITPGGPILPKPPLPGGLPTPPVSVPPVPPISVPPVLPTGLPTVPGLPGGTGPSSPGGGLLGPLLGGSR